MCSPECCYAHSLNTCMLCFVHLNFPACLLIQGSSSTNGNSKNVTRGKCPGGNRPFAEHHLPAGSREAAERGHRTSWKYWQITEESHCCSPCFTMPRRHDWPRHCCISPVSLHSLSPSAGKTRSHASEEPFCGHTHSFARQGAGTGPRGQAMVSPGHWGYSSRRGPPG